MTDYAIVKKRQKASEIESKRSIIRTHLIPWRGPVALDQLGPRDGLDLERSLADRSRKTFNNVAAVVNSMFRWAVTWGEIRQVPFVLQGVKMTRKEHEFYDFEEYDLLLGACPHADPRAELILLMGADEGMRMGEMRELRRTDVMIASRRLTIARRVWKKSDVDVPKGGLVCQLSMTERMADAFRRNRHLKGDLVLSYPDGTRLSEETTRSLFRRLCRLAGVPDKGIQALRHTFCSHLAMLGRYPIEIQKAARHQHIETTMGYMHLSPRRQESAIDVLNRRNWREMGDGPREGAGEIAK